MTLLQRANQRTSFQTRQNSSNLEDENVDPLYAQNVSLRQGSAMNQSSTVEFDLQERMVDQNRYSSALEHASRQSVMQRSPIQQNIGFGHQMQSPPVVQQPRNQFVSPAATRSVQPQLMSLEEVVSSIQNPMLSFLGDQQQPALRPQPQPPAQQQLVHQKASPPQPVVETQQADAQVPPAQPPSAVLFAAQHQSPNSAEKSVLAKINEENSAKQVQQAEKKPQSQPDAEGKQQKASPEAEQKMAAVPTESKAQEQPKQSRPQDKNPPVQRAQQTEGDMAVEIQKLKETIAELAKRNQELEVKLSALSKPSEPQQQKPSEKELISLRQRNEQLSKSIMEVREEVEDVKARYTRLWQVREKERYQAGKKCAEMSDEIREKDKDLQALASEILRYKAIEAENVDLNHQCDGLREQLERNIAMAGQLNKELPALRQENAMLKEQLTMMQFKNQMSGHSVAQETLRPAETAVFTAYVDSPSKEGNSPPTGMTHDTEFDIARVQKSLRGRSSKQTLSK